MPYGTAFAVASIGRFGFSAANAGNGACSAYPPQALDMTGRNLLIMHDDLAGCTSAPRSSCRPISPSPNGLDQVFGLAARAIDLLGLVVTPMPKDPMSLGGTSGR